MSNDIKSNDREPEVCSFCMKSGDQVNKLIAGANAFICDECVELCHAVVMHDLTNNDPHDETPDFILKQKSDTHLLTPMEIHAKLDEFIIGQTAAKKTLSVAVYNHYKRILYGSNSDVELEKSNILLFGPTGTGKTLLAKTLAKLLNVPFAIADATTLTEAGYVGEDVENIILQLLKNADGDIRKAESGIIFIDEIDKISRKDDGPSITRDVSGEGVQQALLKIIEGTVANIPPQGGRKHPNQEYIPVNTTNILFICGGAFDGLDKIIMKRKGTKSLGFARDTNLNSSLSKEPLYNELQAEDLIRYGLIPEFVGRLPVVAGLDPLDEEMLVRILIEPKNSLVKQYKEIFRFENIELEFTDDALSAVAKLAIKRKTGARGLRTILEHIIGDIMYTLPSRKDVAKCIIDENVINNTAQPTLILKESSYEEQNEV